MRQRPAAFGIQPGVEGGGVLAEQLFGAETVEAQQPVCLIQAMLPQQRRLGVFCGQERVLYHGDIGGEKDPLELIAVIEALCQAQDVEICIFRGADDELGALACGGELRSVAVFGQLLFVFFFADADLPHGRENGSFCFVGGQRLQAALRRQFDIDAEAVRQKAQLLH